MEEPTISKTEEGEAEPQLILFFDIRGTVHHAFAPEDQNVERRVLLQRSSQSEGGHSMKTT